MRIDIANPQLQTLLFSVVFLMVLLLSIRPAKKESIFPISTTQELKGIAVLAVIFSHIGYFLSTDSAFLYPWSASAGVAVNLFLFLSGFGLATSALQKKLSPAQFFLKRVVRLFIPLWLVLSVFLLSDFFILHQSYPVGLSLQNFFGLYPQADLYRDIDSPLWFITLIVFYYLVFPFLFWRSRPLWSALAIFMAAALLLRFAPLPIHPDTLQLYNLHFAAFPSGVLFATLLSGKDRLSRQVSKFCRDNLSSRTTFLALLKPVAILGLLAVFVYTSINSGVGQEQDKEQIISLITVLTVVLIFLLKNVSFSLLHFFGLYSYEIYLFHWPLLYRYDFLYRNLQPFLATLIYLGVFLALGFTLQKISGLASAKVEKVFLTGRQSPVKKQQLAGE